MTRSAPRSLLPEPCSRWCSWARPFSCWRGARCSVMRRGGLRDSVWLAPLLLAMHARYYLDFNGAAETVLRAVPLAGGAVLLLLALRPWRELLPPRAVAQAA